MQPVACLLALSQPAVDHFFIFFPAAVVYKTNGDWHLGQVSSKGSEVPFIHSMKSQPVAFLASLSQPPVLHFFIFLPKRVKLKTKGAPHLGQFSSRVLGSIGNHLTYSQPSFFLVVLFQERPAISAFHKNAKGV